MAGFDGVPLDQLQGLQSDLKSGNISPASSKIINSLDVDTLKSLQATYFPAKQVSSGNSLPQSSATTPAAPQTAAPPQSPAPSQQQSAQQNADSTVTSAYTGLRQGIVQGAAQLGNFALWAAHKVGLESDASMAYLNGPGNVGGSKLYDTLNKDYHPEDTAAHPTANTIGNFIGSNIPSMALYGGAGALADATGVGRHSILGLAAQGGLVDAEYSDDQDKGVGAVEGAILNPIFGVAAHAVGTIAKQVAQNLPSFINKGIDATLGMATGNSSITKIENMAAKTPGVNMISGMGAKQAQVADQVKSYVQNTIDDFNSKIGTDDIKQKVAQSVSNNVTAKLQADDTLFTKFKDSDSTYVPTTTGNQAQTILGKFNSPDSLIKLSPDQQNILNTVAKNAGNPQTLTQLHNQYKQIGDIIGDLDNSYKKAGSGSKSILSSFIDLKDSAGADLQSAAEKAGKLPDLQAANAFHQENIVPINKAGLGAFRQNDDGKMLATPQDIEQVINKNIVFNKGELNQAKARVFLNNLDPVGRQAMEGSIINKTYNDIINRYDQDPKGIEKLGTSFNNILSKYSPIMSQPSKDMMNGIKTVISQAGDILSQRRSSGSIESAKVLGEAVAGLAAHAATGEGVPIIAGVATGSMLLRLIESQTGLRVLQKIGNSPNARYIADNLIGSSIVQAGSINNSNLTNP